MIRRWAMMAAAFSSVCCGGGQSGTEGERPAPESPFQIVTAAGERLSQRDGRASVSYRDQGPAAVELAVSGVDASGATWSLLLVSVGEGLLGTYEAVVSAGPTAPGVATVARRSADTLGGDVSVASEGTVRVDVVYAAALAMSGRVEATELSFSFEGPMLLSCSVPEDLLPDAPRAPSAEGASARVLVTDVDLETSFCRNFVRAPRSAK